MSKTDAASSISAIYLFGPLDRLQLYYSFHPSIGYFCSISKIRFALTQFEVKQEMRWPSLLWLRKAALKAALCFSRIKSIFCKIGTFRATCY